jgi:hypothetical protein
MASSDANGDGKGLIKLSYFGMRKRSNEVRQTRFVHTRQAITHDPTGMLQTFLNAYGDLG